MSTRYESYGEIASGGMATVEYGRLFGAHSFSRAVAIKRLHAHFAKDPSFVAMFIDEARLSARLVHANIIPTLDVIDRPGELALVMEYVHGESLANLLQASKARGELVPVRVATALLSSVLHGLHAAHEARDEQGQSLGIVHRDVSPQNILIGADGIPRILDFGIAKAVGQMRSTPQGEIKGKLAYIAPEQLHHIPIDRRADVYGAAAVLWETLTGFPIFDASSPSEIVRSVLQDEIDPPSRHAPQVSPELDAIVLRGLARERELRFESAHAMAVVLERSVGIATQSEVSEWLQDLAGDALAKRALLLRKMQERGSRSDAPLTTGAVSAVSAPPGAAGSTRPIALDASPGRPVQRNAGTSPVLSASARSATPATPGPRTARDTPSTGTPASVETQPPIDADARRGVSPWVVGIAAGVAVAAVIGAAVITRSASGPTSVTAAEYDAQGTSTAAAPMPAQARDTSTADEPEPQATALRDSRMPLTPALAPDAAVVRPTSATAVPIKAVDANTTPRASEVEPASQPKAATVDAPTGIPSSTLGSDSANRRANSDHLRKRDKAVRPVARPAAAEAVPVAAPAPVKPKPACAPVSYENGIRRINPDCQVSKPR